MRKAGASASRPPSRRRRCGPGRPASPPTHDERFTYQENFQLRGDLVEDEGGWSLAPRRLVGGFEPPKSQLAAYKANAAKIWRFHRAARRELARR